MVKKNEAVTAKGLSGQRSTSSRGIGAEEWVAYCY